MSLQEKKIIVKELAEAKILNQALLELCKKTYVRKQKEHTHPLKYLCEKEKGLICPDENYEIIKLMLEHRADPNITDEEGRTPLRLACEYSLSCGYDTETILLLLDNTAIAKAGRCDVMNDNKIDVNKKDDGKMDVDKKDDQKSDIDNNKNETNNNDDTLLDMLCFKYPLDLDDGIVNDNGVLLREEPYPPIRYIYIDELLLKLCERGFKKVNKIKRPNWHNYVSLVLQCFR
jgi:hypothetical protein